MTDLAQLIRDEITDRQLTNYRVSIDLEIDPTNFGRFMNKERDMYLATASRLFDYLGLEVVKKKTGKHKRRNEQ